MELTQINGLRILKANKGFKLKRIGDDNNYSESFYLGVNDYVDNFIEISDEDVEKILEVEKEEEENEMG